MLQRPHVGDRAALVGERILGDVPALPFGAEAIRDGHAHVLEEHLREHRPAVHFLDRLHREAGRVHRHHHARDAEVLRRRRVGANEQDHPLRPHREAGPDLLPVHDVVVAVTDGLALERGQVAAGAGLGVAGAPLDLAAQDRADVLLLLLLRAVLDERGSDPGEPHVAEAQHRRLHARHLFFQDHLLADRAAAAADLARPIEADPALCVEVLVPFEERRQVVHAFFGVHRILPRALREMIADEGAYLGAECFLFLAVSEVHWIPLHPCSSADMTRS